MQHACGTAVSFAVICWGKKVLGMNMQESQKLIIRAYEEARRSGKTGWKRMTTAVLKNRLLDLTDRSFDESKYGASSLIDFVLRHSDMLSIDKSEFPPIVELNASVMLPKSEEDVSTPRYRIRQDLWQAAIDYSSGTRYVWDVHTNEAIPSDDLMDAPIVRPITADIQRELREEFSSLVSAEYELDKIESNQIERWIEESLGMAHLPTRLKSGWITFFRDKVRDHLSRWFDDSGLQRPDDMTSPIERDIPRLSPKTGELRELVVSVVREMTHQELSTLNLPARAVLRVARSS